MNKLLPIGVVVVVVVAGVAVVLTRKDDKTVKVTNSATGQTSNITTGNDALVAVDACDVLTDAIAHQILGDAAVKGDTSAGNASSDDVSVSNCTYYVRPETGNAAEKLANTKGVSILVRAAKTKAGVDGNKSVFATLPTGAENVSGIGDKAYFKSDLGQLSVLKGGNYYIVSNYSGKATSGTLESDKALAELISFR